MIEYHKRPFLLREIKIEVTHNCNLSCIHCSSEAGSASSREMSENDCIRIIREAAEMGVKEVAFSGGEPLQWFPQLSKAVKYAANKRLEIKIYTSGNDENISEKIHSLKKNGANVLVFSLFGASSIIHEGITMTSNSFQNTLNALDIARKAGINSEIHFVPMADNYKELNEIAKLAKQKYVSRISVLRFVPQGRGCSLKKGNLNYYQNLELKNIIQDLRNNGYNIRIGSPYNFLMLNNQPKCCAGIDRITIGPDLKISPCDAFKKIKAEEVIGTNYLSSLETASLSECWEHSPYLEAVREYLTTPFAEKCASCKALEKCISGCVAQKLIAYGNLEKRPDPMCLLDHLEMQN